MKRKVNFKQHELHDAIKEQQAEFEKAIFCQGEYEVLPKYKHLQVSHLDWVQMSSNNVKGGSQFTDRTDMDRTGPTTLKHVPTDWTISTY